MSVHATIFIPDISGYTDFLTKTELDHSSHIINELLEVIVTSNEVGFTLSEIEGDAVLFYKKGEVVGRDALVKQCLAMFKSFHNSLKLIERDTICQCGACQTASDLTLKFVVHYGIIKEISVTGFNKASGLDMVIAHRLLKNRITLSEYILASESYLQNAGGTTSKQELDWQSAHEEYTAIGRIAFEYASLQKIKESIPPPPPREETAFTWDDDAVGIEIKAPIVDVHNRLADLKTRHQWSLGMKESQDEHPITRAGRSHRCVFDEFIVDVVPVGTEAKDNEMIYIEQNKIAAFGLDFFVHCHMSSTDTGVTKLLMRLAMEDGSKVPEELFKDFRSTMKPNLEAFKELCEQERPRT